MGVSVVQFVQSTLRLYFAGFETPRRRSVYQWGSHDKALPRVDRE